MSHGPSMQPEKALELLKEGNQRFLNQQNTHSSKITLTRRKTLTLGQSPYATILACSDSRVSPEHLFDAGLGDLFICRVAGNVVDEAILGSIEYAAVHTGCPLLLVLGHTSCGACGATVARVKRPDHSESFNIDDLIRRILPAALVARDNRLDDRAWSDATARANVSLACHDVMQRSLHLRDLVNRHAYAIVGGFYDLDSGIVEFMKPSP